MRKIEVKYIPSEWEVTETWLDALHNRISGILKWEPVEFESLAELKWQKIVNDTIGGDYDRE